MVDSEPKILTSTTEVIEALGGLEAVATLTGSKYGAVWNWQNFVKFPAKTYVVMTDALAAKGLRAPASLWGMIEAPSVVSNGGADASHSAEASS
jgi:hypothetical protein